MEFLERGRKIEGSIFLAQSVNSVNWCWSSCQVRTSMASMTQYDHPRFYPGGFSGCFEENLSLGKSATCPSTPRIVSSFSQSGISGHLWLGSCFRRLKHVKHILWWSKYIHIHIHIHIYIYTYIYIYIYIYSVHIDTSSTAAPFSQSSTWFQDFSKDMNLASLKQFWNVYIPEIYIYTYQFFSSWIAYFNARQLPSGKHTKSYWKWP
jgi:hypothetical protein